MTTHSDLINLVGRLQDSLPANISKKVKAQVVELGDAILNLETQEPMEPTLFDTLSDGSIEALGRYLIWDNQAGLDFEQQQILRDVDRDARAQLTRDDIEGQGFSRQQQALEQHIADPRAGSCPCYAHQQIQQAVAV